VERESPRVVVDVLVVDDQPVFREVLRDVVAATPNMRVAGEAASGEEAVAAVEALAPALVLMDKRMPGMGGVKAAQAIRQRHPGTAVILVSVEDPDPALAEASGALGFLPKGKISPRALAAIWSAHVGG
jgi:DNA-binding NarL/FixJ family response regulator